MANGTGILNLGVPSNTPSGGITTVPEIPDAPRRTAGEMLESLAEDVRPYAGPHLTGGVLNVAKPIAALIDYIRKNPGRSAQFALENSMAGDTKLALESAMQAGRDVGSGQLGSAAYNTATAAGAAAAAALPVVGAKMLGLKTKLPATDEASRSGQGLLDRILSDTGGSESVQPLFSSYDPADQLATMFDLNTLKDADVDFARREIMRITRERFADGPEYLTVYRGGPVKGDAVPVTTEKSTAQFHAKLHGSPVVEYKIHRDDVLADIGLLRKNEFLESELLVRPSALVPTDKAKPFTLHEAKQTDFGGGGPELHGEGITLGAAMPDGVGTEGTEQIRFSIAETGPDGKVRFPGTATVNLVGNYGKGSLTSQVEGLVNIEVLPEFRGQGVGKRLVSALDASSPDGLKLYDIQEEARGYWEKLGAVDFKRNEDGLLTAVLPKSVK